MADSASVIDMDIELSALLALVFGMDIDISFPVLVFGTDIDISFFDCLGLNTLDALVPLSALESFLKTQGMRVFDNVQS